MKYFSGFSLKGEETLFSEYLYHSNYCVAGFSYGAQKALEYVYASNERIDRLILLSPAFFQMQKTSFIRAQLRYFALNKDAYITQFQKNVSYPSDYELGSYIEEEGLEALEALLTYVWDKEKIDKLIKRGITIEVFLGAKDKIIDTKETEHFFRQTNTYVLKDAGHLLRGEYD